MWSDDFAGAAGAAADATNWTATDSTPQRAGEVQCDSPNNATLDGQGSLVLTARREASCDGAAYSSGRVESAGQRTFRYGYFEARIKMATSGGAFPEFRMLGANLPQVGWPLSGETDIAAVSSDQPDVVHTGVQGVDTAGNPWQSESGGDGSHDAGVNLGDDYHTYGLDWTPTALTWYLDGQAVHTLARSQVPTWLWDQDNYLVLSLGVVDTNGAAAAGTYPQSMDVDWVRGYGIPLDLPTTATTAPTAAPTTTAPTIVPATTAPAVAPTSTPTTVAAAGATSPTTGGKLSGLPWQSGVWTNNGLNDDLAFGSWRGRSLDLVQQFVVRTQGWSGITNPVWPVDTAKAFPGRIVLSVPTFPEGAGSNEACASGAYDGYWKQLGAFLVAHNRPDTIIRLGWEFNGTFMYWHADATGAAFKGCYQHAAAALKAADPRVLMDWTFNAHGSAMPTSGNPYDAYPGNQYVDFIGIDSYDHYPAAPTAAAFTAQCDGSNGLCTAITFARTNGKRLGVGEWGVSSCGGGGGGDNPLYIEQMYNTFHANADVMGYETYFEDPTGICSSIVNGQQNSQAAAKYKALFGGGA